jgi:hypothetical protein
MTKILPTIGRVVWFTPSRLTPVVASVAREYMGLGRLPHLDIRIGDVRQLVHTLSKEAPYDFVVEDVFFDGRGIDKVDEYVAALARLVAPSGWLVRGDRDLPSSLNRTRSPTLKFAKLKGPRYFFAFSPNREAGDGFGAAKNIANLMLGNPPIKRVDLIDRQSYQHGSYILTRATAAHGWVAGFAGGQGITAGRPSRFSATTGVAASQVRRFPGEWCGCDS